MIEELKKLKEKKIFHVIILILLVVIILVSMSFIIIKYNVEGETNMPFKLSKISIISSSEGIDKESEGNRWAFDIYQNNDIFIYIDKNENYKKESAIKNIKISNFKIETDKIDNTKIYKPNEQEENVIFKYDENDVVNELQYEGSNENELKKLKISNQGGIVAFRCLKEKVAEYLSNDEEINHAELLKKANVTQDMLKVNLSFDFTIELEDGKQFKTNMELQLPKNDVIEKGTTQEELTDMSKYIFKRIKN